VSGGSLGKVQVYNVATKSWVTRAAPLSATNGVQVTRGKIHVSGGVTLYKNSQASLYGYDPATNRWTRKRDMPNTTHAGVSGAINDELYVVTGCDQEDRDFYQPTAFCRYNPVTDRWATLPARLYRIAGPRAG
jgi:N-acetylneuraminic acid mutarotase